MTFLFDTSAEDGCPEGSGLIVVRPHSLLSELGGRRFTGRIEREDTTRLSNDLEIVTGNCRYAKSLRLSSPNSAGDLQPVPVSPAVSAFRAPAVP